MAAQTPPFTIGIEEEYLLVDTETFALADAPDALISKSAQQSQTRAPTLRSCAIP